MFLQHAGLDVGGAESVSLGSHWNYHHVPDNLELGSASGWAGSRLAGVLELVEQVPPVVAGQWCWLCGFEGVALMLVQALGRPYGLPSGVRIGLFGTLLCRGRLVGLRCG